MTSNASGVRFVRCPKCQKVIMEFAEVPVYQCGGCSTVLRAKNRASGAEKTVTGSLEVNSENLTGSSSLAKESISLAKRLDSLEVNNEMGKEDGINVLAENHPEEIIQARKEFSVEKETDNPLLQISEGANRHSLNEKTEKSSDSSRNDAAISQAYYDGSGSSRDEEPKDRVPPKYRLLSRRTFRHKKVSSIDDSTETETRSQTSKLPIELSNERSASDIKNGIAPSGDGLPHPHIKPRLLERDTTFASEDFHSIQNQMGSDIENGDSSSLSKDTLFQRQTFEVPNAKLSIKVNNLESGHMRILRKVDELRDELDEFLTKTVEDKGVSNFKPRRTQFPLSDKPPCSNLPSRPPKVPLHDHEAEKNSKAKKQAIKQYYRPVYGGAPFVICYKCWKLLQLPADFLVARKRLHKLRCYACSEVLVFSFRPKVHTVSHTPNGAQHPLSEVDHEDGYTTGDPISHSESYSSEAGPVLNVSRSSSYSIQGRERKKLNDSRLHRLMGYSSASELLFQMGHYDEGYQSTEQSTPHFYNPLKGDYMRYGHYGTETNTPKSTEIEEVDDDEESHKKGSNRTRGSAIPGLLKKGVRKFSHGFESMKMQMHSKG